MNRCIEENNTHGHNQSRTSRSSGCIPVQRIQTVLSKGTHKSIKYFDHGNQHVQLDHGLATNPMVKLSNTDRQKHVFVDGVDDANLNQLIGMPGLPTNG